MSGVDLGRLAEQIEFDAWADLMDAVPEETRAMLQADCRVVGGALSISAKSIPLATFNRAIGLGLASPADASSVAALASHVRENSAPLVQIQVAPFARPEGLDSLLESAGFALSATRWAKMGRATSNPPTSAGAIAIEPVAGQTAADFAKVVLQGFGMPPFMGPWLEALAGRKRWRCYVVRRKSDVVAGAAMYLGDRHAWLGITATVPQARRLGAQGALIARRIADAGALGKAWAFTETGILDGPNPSLANMYRTGFELLHERSNWVLAA